MNQFFTSILAWFKNAFKLIPEDKTQNETASDFKETTAVSIAGAIAERITSLTLSDNGITVVGENERAKFMSKFAEWFNNTKLSAVCETAIGTGDCIARPNTDGKRIGLDIIPNDKFVIVSAVGDFLYSVLIKCDELKKDNSTFERWELHKLNEDADGTGYVTITQVAFKDGKQIPVSSVDAWADIIENQIVPNCDRLLFGRFKNVKTNRKDINSANGVPITFGNEYIVNAAKKSYQFFNDEFDKSEKFIFADKRVFRARKVKNSDGTTSETSELPKGKENVIMTVNGSTQIDGTPLIHEFNPEIRETALDAGIERNFRMLELFCGLSEGILSKSTITYTNVDEVRKSTQATFAYITRLRKMLEIGISDLFYALDVICNMNELTPMGEYEINFDWSDSFVESMTERFNQLLQSLNMGAISKAEFRAWVMSEKLDIAEEELSNIQQNSDSLID